MNELPDYEPKGFALEIFRDRYALHPKETFKEACVRVAETISQAETIKNKEKYNKRFYKLLATNRFCPAGRIWSGCGRQKGNLNNCYVLPKDTMDSREGWGSTIKDTLIISGTGGGVGTNFSNVRPRGTPIKGTGGEATGSISLMRMINSVCDELRTGGGRRSALMFCLDYNHPDLLEFLSVKLDKKEISNANISVCINDKFIECVKNNKDIHLEWQGKIVSRVSAKKVWDILVENALKSGDPGLLNLDHANKMGTTSYFNELVASNPCFTGDMRIHTRDGIIKFNDLYKDRNKTSLNVTIDNRIIDNKHIDMTRNGVSVSESTPVKLTARQQQIYILETQHGHSLRCTEYHEFPTPEGRKKLKDLKNDDVLLLQSSEGYWGNKGSYEDGLLIGILTGDGTFVGQEDKTKICLSFWDEDEFANSILDIVNSKIKHYNRDIRDQRNENDRWRNREFEISLCDGHKSEKRISSVLLHRYLNKKFNIDRTIKKDVPKCIWEGSRNMVRGYLAGFFQTDGTVLLSGDHKKSTLSVRLNQSNIELLKSVQILLNNFGIVSSVYTRRPCGQSLLPDGKGGNKLYKTKTNYELIINRPNSIVFEEKINFAGHKQHILQERLDKRTKQCNKKERFITRIKNIKKDNIEDVYCLTEFQTNSIIVNGCITAQCGEQLLPAYGVCCLGSIVLGKHVVNDALDWDMLAETITLGVRFLDNVLDVTHYPLKQIEEVATKERRIGLGVMGLSDMFVKLGIKYSSQEALNFADKLMNFIKKKSYEANTYLSIERGQFPLMDREKHLKTGFVKGLSKSIKHRIREYGLRNCCILSIAPNGTVSILSDSSSSIEPMFSPVYKRSYNEHKNTHSEMKNKSTQIIIHPLLKDFVQKGKDISVFEGAHDISPEQHIKIQQVCQKHIDGGISKTINIPQNGFSKENLSKLLLDNISTLKGTTIYRDGSKGQSPLMPIPIKEAQKYLKNIEKLETHNIINDCPSGSCDL